VTSIISFQAFGEKSVEEAISAANAWMAENNGYIKALTHTCQVVTIDTQSPPTIKAIVTILYHGLPR
jgi:hypothetical protein